MLQGIQSPLRGIRFLGESVGAVANPALYGFLLTPLVGGTSASIDLSYNPSLITDGIYYFVLCPAADPAPNASQIKLGQNGSGVPGAWWDDVDYASLDTYSPVGMLLTPLTPYKAYAVHESDANVFSNIVSADFTTHASTDPNDIIYALFGGTAAGGFYDFTDARYLISAKTASAGGNPVVLNGGVGVAIDLRLDLAEGGAKTQSITAGGWTNTNTAGGVNWSTFTDNGDGSLVLFKSTHTSGITHAYSTSLSNIDLVAGEIYRVTYTATGVSGTVQANLSNTTNIRSTGFNIEEGTHTRYVYVDTTQANAFFNLRSIVANSGCTISNISIANVNGNHLIVGATAAKFVADANSLTGYSTEFDSTDRFTSFSTINLGGNDNLLVSMALDRTQNAANAQLFQHGTTVQISGMAPDFTNGDEYTFNDGTADLEAQSATTPERVVYTATRVKSGTAALRINGVEAESGAASSGTLETATLNLGATGTPSNYFAGKMYAAVFYNGAFTATDRNNVENSLAAKCGVTL